MANYKKLTDVEVMEEVSENSMALVNENGVLKQVPCGAGFGGGGVATAIIKYDGYDVTMNNIVNGGGASPAASGGDYTYKCINMTFQEVLDILHSGQPIKALLMTVTDGFVILSMDVCYTGTIVYGVECVVFVYQNESSFLYWTDDGISIHEPTSNQPA